MRRDGVEDGSLVLLQRGMRIDITIPEAYKGAMTFTANNLPDKLLTPPIPAPNQFVEPFWERNWSIYFIARHWPDEGYGRDTAIVRWLKRLDPRSPELSRQRILTILGQTAWNLRDYTDDELGIESPQRSTASTTVNIRNWMRSRIPA